MKFVMFDHPTHDGATTIAINPAHVHAVVAAIGPNGRDSRVSALLMSHASDEGIGVVGSVAEVVAALEAAGAPAVAPVVEIPGDAGAVVLRVLDALANAAEEGGWDYLDETAVDIALTGGSLDGWEDTAEELRALAARLRGAR